jgi:hypothetical protein
MKINDRLDQKYFASTTGCKISAQQLPSSD